MWAYYLDSPVTDPAVSGEWSQRVLRDKLCCGRGCGSLKPRHYGEPVDVELEQYPSFPIEPSPLAAIVARSLYDVLEHHLEGEVVGRCILGGQPLDDYVSVYTPAYLSVTIRGDASTEYRTCPHCGFIYPKGGYRGDHMLLNEFRGRLAAQYACHGTFIVLAELRQQIDFTSFGEIELARFPVI